jgi:hypothetical protein
MNKRTHWEQLRIKWPFFQFWRAYRYWDDTRYNNRTWKRPCEFDVEDLSKYFRSVRRLDDNLALFFLRHYAKRDYRRSAILLPFLILLAEAL